MDKTELRKQVIDFIVVYLHPKGEMIGRSELSGQVKKRVGDGFASDPQWNRFYDSVIADITSPANDVILITEGNLIGLSDLGRSMGDTGGYVKYKTKCAQTEKEKASNEEKQRKFDRTHKITVSTCAVLTLVFTVLSFFLTPESEVWSHILYMVIGTFIGVAIAAPVEVLLRYLVNRVRVGR